MGTPFLVIFIFFCLISGENLYLNLEVKHLRVSRDWVGDHWVDVVPNPNILCLLSATSMDTKLSVSSAVSKETKSVNSPSSFHKVVTSQKLCAVEEEMHDLAGMTLTHVTLKDDCINNKQLLVLEAEEGEYYSNHVPEENEENLVFDLSAANDVKLPLSGNGDDNKGNNVPDGHKEDALVEHETAELKCEAKTMETLTE